MLRTEPDEDGQPARLIASFGELRLDDISRPILLEWWAREIEARGLKPKTGKNYLDTVAAVLGNALDLDLKSGKLDPERVTRLEALAGWKWPARGPKGFEQSSTTGKTCATRSRPSS